MESVLYNRIYQRVKSEIDSDEQFCAYVAEICTDPNSHCDDLRDILDTILKTSYTNISETRRQHLIYALLDMIETDREKSPDDKKAEENEEDDIDQAEKIERDGECKLCGCEQRITSMSFSSLFSSIRMNHHCFFFL